MLMKRVLLYFFIFLLSVQAFAQRTPAPVNGKSNKIIVVFPDTLSAGQIYQEVGKALVQYGFNVDSREQSFGLLLAFLQSPIAYDRRDSISLRVAVIKNEVTITGSFTSYGFKHPLKYIARNSSERVRWDKVMNALNSLPVMRMEYEYVQF